ncbi:MAG TPA: hypothetical protein ENH28_05255 [Euryarchaeota archaeon]|nr:hypothetical protein [Euryarchaeota archaeon]
MVDLTDLKIQVQTNCQISDARHWGTYSICGLILRFRNFYRWSEDIKPWEEPDMEQIMSWIDDSERLWRAVETDDFHDINVEGESFSPFDLKGINRVLEDTGYMYGAGYAGGLKPTFFLAEVVNIKKISGVDIYYLGKELARDLDAYPAMSQDGIIYARRESMKYFLYDKILELGNTGKISIKDALQVYDFDPFKLKEESDIGHRLEKISGAELETYIYHEIGEVKEPFFKDSRWQGIIQMFPNTKVEKLARAIGDIMADTNNFGMLNHIIQYQKRASLGFYVAFIDGFRKLMFPEIIESYQKFMETGDWEVIEEARIKGHERAEEYAGRILDIYDSAISKGRDFAAMEITRELIASLGV